jgi:hydrogenase maturation protease
MDDIARTGLKIIGFGNRFRSDDGFGPVIIEELEKLDISPEKNIEIIDGGTSGSDLIFHLKECPRVIIVDALDAGQEKGEIACIEEKDIDSFAEKNMSSLSLHDLDLSDVLKIARAMKLKTDITIIGINPLSIEFGDRISPQLKEKIPRVITMILELIKD